ncbi:hypothetical protein ERJ75_001846500 [Trypanosoma vivax]|nr:hypothetical protein ERJ75_001846500 [Trypanosoma vivax]
MRRQWRGCAWSSTLCTAPRVGRWGGRGQSTLLSTLLERRGHTHATGVGTSCGTRGCQKGSYARFVLGRFVSGSGVARWGSQTKQPLLLDGAGMMCDASKVLKGTAVWAETSARGAMDLLGQFGDKSAQAVAVAHEAALCEAAGDALTGPKRL